MKVAGAEKLIEKIGTDAQRAAEKYWHDADVRKQQMRESLLREIGKRKAEIDKMAAQAGVEKKKRMAAVYDLEYRKELLAAKQEMMAKAKDLAKQKLAGLSDSDYKALMSKRLVACAQNGAGSIAVGKSEKRLNAAFVKAVNAELKKQGGEGSVTLEKEKRDIEGGFIYLSEGLEINMSLASQLGEAWQDVETQVAAVLFED